MNYRLVNQMYWFLCHKDMNNYDCNHHFWIVFYDYILIFGLMERKKEPLSWL